MAKIVLKKSSITGKIPLAADLEFGELAINYTDGHLYYKNADSTVKEILPTTYVTTVDGNSGAITDSQLLTAIKKVDGSGSGLDADYLRGYYPTASDVNNTIVLRDNTNNVNVTGVNFTTAGGARNVTWNSGQGTYDMGLDNGVTLQVGQETHFYAKATEGIPNGALVMFAGAQGDHLLISKANLAATGFQDTWIVGVATQAFTANQFGYVTCFGKINDLNTAAWAEGTILYADPSNLGGLTATKPTAPNHIIEVAAVVRSHATQGTLLVRPTFGKHLSDLNDVSITSPSAGQLLAYTSAGVWQNVPAWEFVGTSGYSGYSGQSGYSGAQGASGYSGYSGASGYMPLGALNWNQTQASQVTVALASSFPYSIASVTITTNGNPVQIIATGDANPLSAGGWGIIQLYRGTTAIGGAVQFEGSSSNENNPYAVHFIDSPSAGSYTYYLKVNQLAGGSVQFGEASGPVISVVELQNVQGNSGYSGHSGYSGQNGASGYSGYSGFSGYSGQNGVIGVDGASGYSGYSGAQGTSGYSGYSGISGYSGAVGTSGFSGISGYSGAVGASGISGYSGFSGQVGTSGYSGYSGFSGMSGATGMGFTIAKTYASVASLTADTSPTGIVAGQFAIIDTGNVENAENSRLYLWNGSAYQYVTDLSGAQGIKGDSGFSGTSGFSGAVGISGYSGISGFSGISGYSGAVGASGISGYSGFSGAVGATGISGYSGATGPQGISGYSGSSLSLNWINKTSNYTASIADRIFANTSGGSFTITLPASPVTGSFVTIADASDWYAHNLIVARNGNTIEGVAQDLTLDVKGVSVEFIYSGSTWEVVASIAPAGPTGAAGASGYSGYSGLGLSGYSGFSGYSGAGASTPTIKTSSYTASSGNWLYCNTTSAAFTITLPASPSTGNYVRIASGPYAALNNITISRNGSTIMGLSEDMIISTNNISTDLIYDGSTWRIA